MISGGDSLDLVLLMFGGGGAGKTLPQAEITGTDFLSDVAAYPEGADFF